jgi:hypothetical protein
MDNLKFRANYGETGNGTAPYNVVNTYQFRDPFGGNPQFTNPTVLNNPNLKSEETSEIEFGLEGAFFKNRLGFDFSYYTRDTKNQIVSVETTAASGYTSQIINAGKINNSGFELLLYGTPVKLSDFSWDVTFNFAKNVNEVMDLPEGLDKIQLARAPFGGAYLNATQGATFQELYGYDFIYDDAGRKVIDPATGFYATSGELTSLGSVLPDFTAGLKNTFTYKNFSLGALIDVSKGGKYYSLTNAWSTYSGMAAITAQATTGGNTIREDGIVLDGVLADVSTDASGNIVLANVRENDMNIAAETFGAYHYHGYGTPSATSIFDASYFKLRELTFGYTLPKLTKFIKSAKVSVYGRNLLFWGLDNKGLDPESIVGGNGNIQGLEGGIVPSTRSFGFNVQVKF